MLGDAYEYARNGCSLHGIALYLGELNGICYYTCTKCGQGANGGNVAGRDATTPTRLSATIKETEEDCLVLTGNVSILNAVSTTKRISRIQL